MILGTFKERKEYLIEFLADNAGNSPLEDRYKAGYIAAVNDLFNVNIEETQVD